MLVKNCASPKVKSIWHVQGLFPFQEIGNPERKSGAKNSRSRSLNSPALTEEMKGFRVSESQNVCAPQKKAPEILRYGHTAAEGHSPLPGLGNCVVE